MSSACIRIALLILIGVCPSVEGQDLFVVTNGVQGGSPEGILRYDGTTGAFINQFIVLNNPSDIEFGPDNNLYASTTWEGGVGGNIQKYDGSTGALLGEFVAAGTGGLEFSLTVLQPSFTFSHSGDLLVSTTQGVMRFDGSDGSFIDLFVPAGIAGLSEPLGLAFGPDDHLYVANSSPRKVLRFDGQTGVFIDEFTDTTPQQSIDFGPDGRFYVSSGQMDVKAYNGRTGEFLRFYRVLGNVRSFTFSLDHNLLIGEANLSGFYKLDLVTGDLMSTFIPKFSGGLSLPDGAVYAPSPPRVFSVSPTLENSVDYGVSTLSVRFSQYMEMDENPRVTLGIQAPYDEMVVAASPGWVDRMEWRGLVGFESPHLWPEETYTVSISGATSTRGLPLGTDTSHRISLLHQTTSSVGSWTYYDP